LVPGKVSPLGASLEGFRLMARRPGALALWMGCVGLAIVVFIGAVYAASLSAPQIVRTGGGAILVLGALIPVGLYAGSVVTAAVYRTLLRPGDKGLGFVRLGPDELRLFAVSLILFVAFFALFFTVLVGGVAIFELAKLRPDFHAPQVTAGYAIVTTIVFLLAFTKASLALPMTFVEKRIRVLGSWNLTSPAFLRLLATFTLVLILIVVVAALMFAVQYGLNELTGLPTRAPWGGTLPAGHHTSKGIQTLGRIASVPVSMVQMTLELVILAAAQAGAYRAIAGNLGEDVAQVF
jgi:hypothetical protein